VTIKERILEAARLNEKGNCNLECDDCYGTLCDRFTRNCIVDRFERLLEAVLDLDEREVKDD